jgi:hypothetical protein
MGHNFAPRRARADLTADSDSLFILLQMRCHTCQLVDQIRSFYSIVDKFVYSRRVNLVDQLTPPKHA